MAANQTLLFIYQLLPYFSILMVAVFLALAKMTKIKPFYYVSMGYACEYTLITFIGAIVRNLQYSWYSEYEKFYAFYDVMQVLFIGALLITAIIFLAKAASVKEKPAGELIK